MILISIRSTSAFVRVSVLARSRYSKSYSIRLGTDSIDRSCPIGIYIRTLVDTYLEYLQQRYRWKPSSFFIREYRLYLARPVAMKSHILGGSLGISDTIRITQRMYLTKSTHICNYTPWCAIITHEQALISPNNDRPAAYCRHLSGTFARSTDRSKVQ